jgi:hypothetical protein
MMFAVNSSTVRTREVGSLEILDKHHLWGIPSLPFGFIEVLCEAIHTVLNISKIK